MAAEALGGKLLGEIETGSLDELLRDVRKLEEKESGVKTSRLGIERLDGLWAKNGGKFEITGVEGLMLLYRIVSTVVSPPHLGTIVVIDVNGQFDVTRLDCSIEDLKHVYIYRPYKGHVKETMMAADSYLLGGKHASMERECASIVVNGAQGGDVMFHWKGWLRVESESEDIPRFGMGVSVEEAMREREERQTAVDNKGWRAVSDWGEYKWKGEQGARES